MIPGSVRIFVCSEPQDMRRSFDALALVVRDGLAKDPQSGALFVFVNKRANRLKVMWFEKNGYCILYKRLHRARFELPNGDRIDARALAAILRGVENDRRRTISS